MAFQLSPGVNISEVDLTTVVPSVATTVGGIAGDFSWGPANTIVTISNEVQLVDRFGKPDSNSANAFFVAANFLAYGSDLKVVRAVASTARNASANGSVELIENEDDYYQNLKFQYYQFSQNYILKNQYLHSKNYYHPKNKYPIS